MSDHGSSSTAGGSGGFRSPRFRRSAGHGWRGSTGPTDRGHGKHREAGRKALSLTSVLALVASLVVAAGLSAAVAPTASAATTTKVTINKQVLRSSPTSDLVGATFALFNGQNDTNPTTDFSPNSCQIQSGQTSCVINVPNSGPNEANSKQYWVKETVPSSGTYSLPQIGVGDGAVANTTLSYPG